MMRIRLFLRHLDEYQHEVHRIRKDLAFSRMGIKKRKPVWLEHDEEGEMDPRGNCRGKWRLLHVGPCEKAIVDSGFYSG